MDRADGRTRHVRELLFQALTDLRRSPARVVLLQPNDRLVDQRRQLIRMAMRPTAAVGQALRADLLVTVVDLVARFPGDPEFLAQNGHLLAVEQAGYKAHALVHDVTLLPRHAPSCVGAKC